MLRKQSSGLPLRRLYQEAAAMSAPTPQRLVHLGFRGRSANGVEYITPPLCNVPAGSFMMGSDPAKDNKAFDDEKPQHRVTLPAYSIGTYPVTLAEYARAMRAGAVSDPWSWGDQFTEFDQLAEIDHPVVRVSWNTTSTPRVAKHKPAGRLPPNGVGKGGSWPGRQSLSLGRPVGPDTGEHGQRWAPHHERYSRLCGAR